MNGFTAHEARRLTGCTGRQLRYWDQIGLVKPSVQATGGRPGIPRIYSVCNLVALKTIKVLLDAGISLQRLRHIWAEQNFNTLLAQLQLHDSTNLRSARRSHELRATLREGVEVLLGLFSENDLYGCEPLDRTKFVTALRIATQEMRLGA